MEIGVVVHGPGIVDSGWAKKIIDILSNFGNVRCRLGGTMGRTAVIDAGLEDIIDISLKLLPSQSLELFNREHVDVIFLLNYGKSPETGRVFGYKVFSHYFKQISNEDFLATNHKSLYESSIPVIQIERPGEEDGSIISWNVILNEQLAKSRNSKMAKLGLGKKNMIESLSFNFEELFDGLKAALDLIEIKPEEVVNEYFSNNREIEDDRSIEKILRAYDDYETSHYTYRKIHGVSPDENIFINGIVVGHSNADSIVLIARDGFIVDIIDGTIKYHGLEKLGPVDLDRVIVKTGLLRKSDDVNPRILSHDEISIKDTERNLYSGEISDDENSFKVAYVDHAAYDIYKFKDFDLVLTIGDDTSLVASDILYRFNIPIIGITDGDLDKVVENGFVNDRSSFIEVASGFDDIVGRYVHEELFMLKDTLEVPYDAEISSPEDFKSIMLNVFKESVIEKVAHVVPSFVEKDSNHNVVSSYQEITDDKHDLDENLDEFIDGFEYDSYEDEDGVYPEGNLGSQEEVYVDESPVDEIYVEHDLEDISDAQLEEIIVEHAPGDYGEVYIDEDDDLIYDEYPEEDLILDEYPDEENDSLVYEEYPDENEYLENVSEDEIYYDELPLDDESPVEEIYVEHDIEESPVEEIYVGHGLVESPVEDIYPEHNHDEEIIYEDIPVEEVFLDENLEETDSLESSEDKETVVMVESKEEIDDEEGWAEYLEDEFGDSDDESTD